MGGEISNAAKSNGNTKPAMASHDGGRARHAAPLLNVRQQDLLQKSWHHSYSSGSDSVGARIFKKIFVTEPAVARIFGLDHVDVKDLTFNPSFRPHADRFTEALIFAVENIQNAEKISQYAQALGANHVKLESRGFKMVYWDVFAEAMTECAIDWEDGVVYCSEAMHAWRLLVSFFVNQMRIGFEQQRRENAAQTDHTSDDHADA
uniref:Globin family profile domain-containing protein n=1 Tax=Plectus sambesii TaxID=2011161 RepID=A0A914XF89_9BILA